MVYYNLIISLMTLAVITPVYVSTVLLLLSFVISVNLFIDMVKKLNKG
jgi:hypothetical protein